MANHAYVKTNQEMSAESISQLIDELNKTVFKNKLAIEYNNGDMPWKPHVWYFAYTSDNVPTNNEWNPDNWGERICWLNDSRSFEMRHGGGNRFIWWIDTLICETIAARFGGKISDDYSGYEEVWDGSPDEINTYRKYCERNMNPNIDPQMKQELIDDELPLIPPEFRNDLLGVE